MDAVAITVIGVVGTALFGMFFMQLQNLREDMKEGFRAAETDRKALEARLTGDINGLEDKFTGLEGRITGLEDRITGLEGRITGLEDRITGLEGKFTGLEVKLEIDPPAEAA